MRTTENPSLQAEINTDSPPTEALLMPDEEVSAEARSVSDGSAIDRAKAEYFEDVIAPSVKGLAAICRREGIQACLAFESQEGEFEYTLVGDPSTSEKMQLYQLLNDCWTIDELITKIILEGRTNGHDSNFLSSIGIPKVPGND